MCNQVEFKKNGNYHSVLCRIITEEIMNMIENFCREKISSGENPSTGIVISGELEIRYLTLGEVAGGNMEHQNTSECEYMLEF